MSSARNELGGSGPIVVSVGQSAEVGQYYALQAGASGCTIGTTNPVQNPSWTGATLAPGAVLMFGLIQMRTLTLSAGSGFLYRR